jgi:hypothetical protein
MTPFAVCHSVFITESNPTLVIPAKAGIYFPLLAAKAGQNRRQGNSETGVHFGFSF